VAESVRAKRRVGVAVTVVLAAVALTACGRQSASQERVDHASADELVTLYAQSLIDDDEVTSRRCVDDPTGDEAPTALDGAERRTARDLRVTALAPRSETAVVYQVTWRTDRAAETRTASVQRRRDRPWRVTAFVRP